ncbi:MAG: phosphate ABC transporter permease subunit PstC [Actinobacteria bacterium]|nr:phosphate ABC transporter permease subunit PstC [Actinomycetota bacterium]
MADLERPGAAPTPRTLESKPRLSDRIFRAIVGLGGFSSLIILGLIAGYLLFRGFSVLQSQGLRFITGFEWVSAINSDGSTGTQESVYGVGAMLVGTLVTAVIALFIGVPVSVFAALYLTFFAPLRLKRILVTVVDLMAAFPSILFGLWGLYVLMEPGMYVAALINKYLGWIPIFSVPVPVFLRSPFIAGLVLAVMIIPIVTAISREVFSQTPLDRIQAAYALGASKWAMIKNVAFPYSYSGVVGGAMLGLGRAMGETVAVFTVLNILYQANFKILLGAGGNLASHIILKFGEASEEEIKALMAAGFVLFLLTLAVNMIANGIVSKTGKRGR